MEIENKDVDLYEELKKELEKSDDEDPSGASAQEPQEPEEDKKESGDENAELSEEEISKLSPRAQKRIREQAAKIKELAEEAAAKAPEEISKENKSAPRDFETVEDFLAAVEDEPSRKLLETFYGLIDKNISKTLSPIEIKNREALFDSEFQQFAKIEGVADYHDDLKKTFMKDKTKSVKDLVGGVVTEIQLSKVGKIETQGSNPNREGKIDTDGLTKEQLYDLLESDKS